MSTDATSKLMWSSKFKIYLTMNATDTVVDIPHDDNTTVGTWQTTPSPAKFDLPFDMWSPLHPKPLTKNTAVEKKIKRRGWSKQFYEK